MAIVRGCNIPDGYFYNIEHNVWAKKQDDFVVLGLTAYACTLTGKIVSFSSKQVGNKVNKNKACATIESENWVGVVKSPVVGEIAESNQALSETPSLITDDPYGRGWLVKLKVANWQGENEELMTVDEAVDAFEIKMEAEGFPGC